MNESQYFPLDGHASSFRLLKVLRGDTVNLQFEVFHASIDGSNAIPYEAISYTWGSEELVNHIQVNDQYLWITENLHAALQHLRLREKDRIIWIDAICIDQSNDVERSQQVQKMSVIFESAFRVMFWLGRPTFEAILLINSLRELESSSDILLREGTHIEHIPWKELWSSAQLTIKSHHDDSLSRQRKGLQVLIKRPWFRRVWILHPWLLDMPVELHVQCVLDIVPGPARVNTWWNQKQNLLYLLMRFRDSEATDQRDMIFALLGIASDPREHRLLRSNYTRSFLGVLHDTVRYWFEACAITVGEVFEVLKIFKSVRVTYCVPSQEAQAARAKFPRIMESRGSYFGPRTSLKSKLQGILACTGDSSLILLEQYHGEVSSNRDTCYAELDVLTPTDSGWESDRTNYESAFKIVPWKGAERNIRLLFFRDEEAALSLLSRHNCVRTLDFFIDAVTDCRPDLLHRTLFYATKTSLTDAVKLMLKRGANANAQGPSGDSALTMASLCGNVEIVRTLIEEGADVNAVGRKYGTALQQAILNGDKGIVRILLDNGADVNAPAAGRYNTVLEAALSHGNGEMVQLLLDRAAKVDCQTIGRYNTVLWWASEYGFTEIVETLLNKGVDINAVGDEYGTALQVASFWGKEQTVQILLNRGADVNIQGGKIYHTALVAAAAHGYKQIVQALLDKGADVNALEGKHNTALQAASRLGRAETVRMLLERGADINAIGEYGTALQAASYQGKAEIVQILLDNGADVNVQGKIGEFYTTALEAAVGQGYMDIAAILFAAGAVVVDRKYKFVEKLFAVQDSEPVG